MTARPESRRFPDRQPSILAVCDSDSYLKWGCATLDALPADWRRDVLLLRTPILPTGAQIAAATTGTFQQDKPTAVIERARLGAELARRGPDLVLAAATGPVAEQILVSAARIEHRPALVTGLPGVALPATFKALRYRSLSDAFITHSYAEQRQFRERAASLQLPVDILLSRLPFLTADVDHANFPQGDAPAPDRVVFAAQAKVPVAVADREKILLSLAACKRRSPSTDVDIKLRARPGEAQTHLEHHPYDELWTHLARRGEVRGDELRFVDGPMSAHLGEGTVLATVSSTAALEAIDAQLPVQIVDDFGVNDEMLNTPFIGSGCVGSLADLAAGRFRYAAREWLGENYFHPADSKLQDAFERLAASSRTGALPETASRVRKLRIRRVRAEIRTALPAPAVRLVRRLQSGYRAATTP
ncbi:hypothetical protein LWF01_03395 [Saxibacter everestensis]|uniref:Uncharacterized protein n=1 Tax=Saxibacter everestensis TaxID=2909229 RepID=A0ABY8QV15_9MICO|nr:hypothetical protein LWF01_03395 [Brevibacteriaceae bacterium ZFBP1038]